MKKISAEILPIGALTDADKSRFMEWMWRMRDYFDMDVLGYPRTIMLKATAAGEPIAYVPLQPVLMYESLAAKEGLSKGQTAMALWQIGVLGDAIARDTGHAEQYFLTSCEREAKSCARHGWTICLHDPEKKMWLMKRKLSQ